MESDDDFDSFSPPPQPSPQVHHRRLKRLKKSIKSHNNSPIKSTQESPESAKYPILTPLVNPNVTEDSIENNPRSSKDSILTPLVNADEMGKSTEKNTRSILTPLVNAGKMEDSIEDSPIKSTGKSPRLNKDPILTKMDESMDSDDSQDFELPSFEALEVGKSFLDSEESNGLLGLRSLGIGSSKDYDSSEEQEGENIDGIEKGLGCDEDYDEDLFGKKRKGAKRELEFGDMVDGNEGDGVGKSDEDLFGKKRKEAKRGLEFGVLVDENEGSGVGNSEEMEKGNGDLKKDKKRGNVDELEEDGGEDTKKKMKKKRMEGKCSDDGEVTKPVVNKRKEEKERRIQCEQLHAETQRVLRETRDVGFRPAPVVHKPISSVLEKIRQRKLEVSKRTVTINNTFDEPGAVKESDVYVEEVEALQSSKTVDHEVDANGMDIEGDLGASPMDIPRETTTHTSNEETPVQKELDVEPTPAFRAPVDDTQVLFDDSQVSSKDELIGDQSASPLEEPFAPSLLAMKLKFDSALPDDSSSDDEDDDKENIVPDLQEDGDDCTSPKGDPVKAFIDEEAEEEDSDNDINCLREDDEDEDMDAEELNDIIATNYEERPTDKERRDELHQKWLEQQDAAGTDHFLRKFKYSSKGRETTIADEEHTDSEDEEEFDNEVEDAVPRDNARMNLKRAKQMITQMFIDKDDVFLSDEEEETGKILEKQRLLRSEEHAKLISPAEDVNSRKIFGLIKNLNIAPQHKRKLKQASILDTMLEESSDSSVKSSFIGRSSDHHLPSSKVQRSSVMRSFVFGRDDSNSRSSILTAEDSSDAVPKDIKSSKYTTAKFTSSQVRSSQSSNISAGENSVETSSLDIWKKISGVKSTEISVGGLSSILDAYKIRRRPVRAEARGL